MHLLKKMLFYMDGRYGMDEFSRLLFIVGLLFLLLANLAGGSLVLIFGLTILAYGALRPLSKEIESREKEYYWYLRMKQKIFSVYWKWRNRYVQRKTFKIYKCSECKQKVRVPKRKKKIRITCPTCNHTFVRKPA